MPVVAVEIRSREPYETAVPGLEYERLDGSLSLQQRQRTLSRFADDPNVVVMLLSLRAGGVGINLVAADTVIIYDPDWNPQNDIQARPRRDLGAIAGVSRRWPRR